MTKNREIEDNVDCNLEKATSLIKNTALMDRAITEHILEEFNRTYNENPRNKVIESIICMNGIQRVALNKGAINRNKNIFSIELPKTKISDQKKSQRCWCVAGLNLLKREVAKNLGVDIETFELSQNHINFYDKLEKSNTFYESIINYSNKELLDRDFCILLDWGVTEGGHWEYFKELAKKYGVVPKSVMPETKDSEDSDVLTGILTRKIKKDAIILRKIMEETKDINKAREAKRKMLEEIYHILCKTLGEPPVQFNYEYYDKNKNYGIIENIEPREFYKKYADIILDDYVVVGNVPMHNKEYNKVYKEIAYTANIVDKGIHNFLNLEIEELKKLVLASLKRGEPVYFACNIRKMNNKELDILDNEMYQFDKVLDVDLKMSKEEMLDYREIRLQHMMVFTGVNIVKNKIDRWKVENSWGDERENKGYYIMNDNFFENFVLECVIHKKNLSQEQLELLKQEPIVFEPWEPMS